MEELNILLVTAAGLGFTHTLFGPDHYLPFIVLSKARQWSLKKTLLTTVCCGIGHVGSSVVIGLLGITLGVAISRIEGFESVRGGLAGWAFFLFGLIYMVYGLARALRNKPRGHVDDEEATKKLTPWILFIIFVLGPCEILVPLLMYPAAQHSTSGVLAITLLFSAVTILTMCAAVAFGYYGLKILPRNNLDRYAHAIAGAAICLSGFAILFLDM